MMTDHSHPHPEQMKKLAIFILGMHRSGTSMLSGLFHNNGFDIGPDLMPGNPANPAGFKENLAIYRLNERILRDNGSCWGDLSTRMALRAGELVEVYRADVQQTIEQQFELVNRFVIKDPRNCLLFPIWSQTLAGMGIEQKVVIPLRHPLEIAYSLRQRDGFALNKGLQLWCNHLLWAERHSRGLQRCFVSYPELLTNPREQFGRLLESLAIHPDAGGQLDTSFVDTTLKHHVLSYENINDKLPAPVKELIDIAREGHFDDTEALNRIHQEMDTYRDYFICKDSQFTTRQQAELDALKKQLENLRGQVQEKQQLLNQKTIETRSLTNQIQQRNQELNQLRQQHQQMQKELGVLRSGNPDTDKSASGEQKD